MEPSSPERSPQAAKDGPADKRLFTPGPLTTSRTVKLAMLHDASSRDDAFIQLVKDIRRRVLAVAELAPEDGFEAVPIQGSGTFGVESVLSSAIPEHGRLLAVVNGAYGRRIVDMAKRHKIPCEILSCPEHMCPNVESIDQCLQSHPQITHVTSVHCETTTGILNPIEEIGAVVARHQRTFIVDAMSSFGAIPLDLRRASVSFLISSANKCIEGVPGFAFVIAQRDALRRCQGQARTLSLDLYDQWQGLEKTGQFRFTPPTHAMLAFAQALRELEAEGGPIQRGRRYQANQRLLQAGMRKLGFKTYLPDFCQSCIITTFPYPADPQFDFHRFYQGLSDRGFVIYPGKLTETDCFRIGTIGRLSESDIADLLAAVPLVLKELGCSVPVR